VNKHQIVCFGEVLWDILPTGAVPGGAPMNVAYHLQKLNKNPALITRIGIDKRGQDLMNIFSQQDVCTDFFQVDTVGSGDAFLAGLLSQLLDNAGSEAALEFASDPGAFIATQRGGYPEYNTEEIKELIQNNSIKV
jgi:sugar/nucleoside kinase (ribokinase family)